MQTPKEKVRCVLAVGSWRVEGDVHVVAGSRLTDTLNAKAQGFFAVTDAVITDLVTNEPIAKPGYIAINRSRVSAVFPVE